MVVQVVRAFEQRGEPIKTKSQLYGLLAGTKAARVEAVRLALLDARIMTGVDACFHTNNKEKAQ
jgi:hypothetical protein